MSTTVILASMTTQMVLVYFKLFVSAELRKHQVKLADFYSGQQDGIALALGATFGTADEATAESSYDSGESWIQVAENIVDEKLSHWVTILEKNDQALQIDYKKMQEDTEASVEEYALENPELLVNALKRNL